MSKRRTDPETGEPTWDVDAAEVEAAARQRAFGLADAEQRRRRQLAAELVAELRRPLIERHGPSDLERIAALAPRTRPAR